MILIEKTLFPFSPATLVEKRVNRIFVALLPYLALPKVIRLNHCCSSFSTKVFLINDKVFKNNNIYANLITFPRTFV